MAFDSVQTPAGKADQVLGGSANYFSVAASFFNPVQIVAVVGEDFPDTHLQWLGARGVDTQGVQRVPGKTFHWTGQYDSNLNEAKTLATALNVFEHFDPKLSAAQKKAQTLFLGNIDPILQSHVLDQMEAPALVAADSMNFWISSKPEELKKTLKRVDILSINEGEAMMLTGQKNIVRAAGMIRDMGPSVLIIKRGEYGAALFTPNGMYLTPAFPVTSVVDPTGAGDSFAGAMVGFLTKAGASRDMSKKDPQGWDTLLRQAMSYGCVMASFTVEDFSLHRLMRLERPELESRWKQFQKMVQFG